MKTLLLLFAFSLLLLKDSSSQFVINEIMYAPSDASNEWFEIHNIGSAAVNLRNWKWKDATSSLRIISVNDLIIDSNDFIVICQDSLKLKSLFPLLPGKIIQTAWSQLNNSGDNVILIEPSGSRIDSVTFSSAWGGSSGGISLEKIDPEGPSNNSSNWSSSIDILHSTPCRQNSVTPKQFDLLLKSFAIAPLFPSAGSILNFDFIIKNIGLNDAENFSLKVYDDINKDSIAQANEMIHNRNFSHLSRSDSIGDNFSKQYNDTGSRQFIAQIFFEADNDTANNQLVRIVYMSSSTSGGGLIINEIMYDPLSNESEWIELYNFTGQSLNLKGWKLKDASSSILLSSFDIFVPPGNYFILAHDSSLLRSFPNLNTSGQSIEFSASLNLNNSGEMLSIFDSLNNLIDKVDYRPDWNNSELPDTKGISLERINPGLGSNDKSNWNSCTDMQGGTPGLQNSIFTRNPDANASITISPNPFSPDGDGFEDFTAIKYRLNIPFGQMRISIFDIKGRKVRTISNNRITGKEGIILFDGYDDNKSKLRIGIYILLIEAIDDENGVIDYIKTPLVIAAKL